MNKTYDIVGHRKFYYTISLSIFAIALLVSVIFGVKVAIEFKGGTMISYSYTGSIDTKNIENIASDIVGQEVTATTGESFKDKSKYVQLSFTSSKGLSADLQSELTEKISDEYNDNSIKLLSSSDVKPSIGKTFFRKCLVAIAFSSVALIIYIGLRFRKVGGIPAGVTAIVALFHDVFIAFATFVIFRIPIDANFMAVALTILGFSINDTIVIYDRIRENKKLLGKKTSFDELVNTSINQSLTRSINTSFAAILVMISVCVVAMLFNVTSILSFSFPLIIGLISGVYSTICIAGPLWVDWTLYKDKRNSSKGRTSNK